MPAERGPQLPPRARNGIGMQLLVELGTQLTRAVLAQERIGAVADHLAQPGAWVLAAEALEGAERANSSRPARRPRRRGRCATASARGRTRMLVGCRGAGRP